MRTALLGALSCALLLVAPTASAAPQPTHLPQTVSGNEAIGTQQVEIGRGHVDLGPRIVDGAWLFLGRDDTVSPPVWRHPADLVLRVNDQALLEVPDDPNYAFLPKGRVHVVPQTQDQRVVWVGWSTQDPDVVQQLDRGGWLVLRGVSGPGRLVTFLANGFEPPTLLWDSGKAAGQRFWVNSNTHTHINWVFDTPGHYTVDVEFAATAKDGSAVSVPAALTFLVGDAAQATQRPATTASSEPPVPPRASSVGGWWWVVGALGAMLVVLVAARGIVSARSRKGSDHVGH